jgi:hypothetical protein
MEIFIIMFLGVLAALLLGVGFLHLVVSLGSFGRKAGELLSRAPMLDLVVTYFTAAPMIVGPIVAGWVGLAAAVAAQMVGTVTWCFLHELANPRARRGPRIVKVINRRVGRFRNHAALWATAVVVPIFWLIRVAEIFLYPFLIVLVRFPRYRQSEWVNCSRQKFDGLVGHDLIWCLYCDWMTGVWVLGTEMLRNVESFWCPIRFDSSKKCENCRQDFPDLDGGWVAADGNMEDVTRVLEQQYPVGAREHGWFGHSARLTIEGEPHEE